MGVSGPKIKDFFIFSQKNFPHISGMEVSRPKLKKTSYISGGNFQSSKPTLKRFLIFREMELAPSLRNSYIFFYISGGNLQSLQNKNYSYFRKWNLLIPKIKKNFIFFQKKFLYLIFFIRVFFIRIFSIIVIRRNFYVVSNKRLLFFNKIFTFI